MKFIDAFFGFIFFCKSNIRRRDMTTFKNRFYFSKKQKTKNSILIFVSITKPRPDKQTRTHIEFGICFNSFKFLNFFKNFLSFYFHKCIENIWIVKTFVCLFVFGLIWFVFFFFVFRFYFIWCNLKINKSLENFVSVLILNWSSSKEWGCENVVRDSERKYQIIQR